jgi:hypothetical protein
MSAGRPKRAHPWELYVLSQQLYLDFWRLAQGRYKLFHDPHEYERLMADPTRTIEYSSHEEARVEKDVEEEIRNGRLNRARKQNRISALKREESQGILRFLAEEGSTKRIKVRGEPDVIEALLSPDITPRQIRDLCREAFMTIDMTLGSDSHEVEVPAWPISAGSVLPRYLTEHAEAFIEARHDRRFPSCNVADRPTNLWKQLWFLSRALAGAVFGIRTRTALNLVGATRPDNPFQSSRYGKTKRKLSKKRKLT